LKQALWLSALSWLGFLWLIIENPWQYKGSAFVLSLRSNIPYQMVSLFIPCTVFILAGKLKKRASKPVILPEST
jgi:hypothetical protein